MISRDTRSTPVTADADLLAKTRERAPEWKNLFDPNKKDKRSLGRALTNARALVVRDFGLATPEPSGLTPLRLPQTASYPRPVGPPSQQQISKFEN